MPNLNNTPFEKSELRVIRFEFIDNEIKQTGAFDDVCTEADFEAEKYDWECTGNVAYMLISKVDSYVLDSFQTIEREIFG